MKNSNNTKIESKTSDEDHTLTSFATDSVFSIYLIDKELFMDPKDNSKLISDELIRKEIIDHVIANVTQKQIHYNEKTGNLYRTNNYELVSDEIYDMLIFEKENSPAWKDYVLQFFHDTKINSNSLKRITNKSVSYLGLYTVGDNIYATTGGYAGAQIKDFIVKKFGLLLLSKLVEESDPIIKKIRESNFSGNKYATTTANRTITGFNVEKGFTKIFNEVLSDLNGDLLKSLGLTVPEETVISAISTDYFSLRNKLSYGDLIELLEQINTIMSTESKFSLGNFIPLRQLRIRKSEVDASFVDYIINNKNNPDFDILLTGPDPLGFLTGAKFKLESDDVILYEEVKRPDYTVIKSIFESVEGENARYTKAAIRRMLKQWKLSVYDDSNNPIFSDIPLINCMETSILFDNVANDGATNQIEVFLFEGEWFVLELNFSKFVDKDFSDAYLGSKAWVDRINFFDVTKFELALFNTCFVPIPVDSNKGNHTTKSDKVKIAKSKYNDLSETEFNHEVEKLRDSNTNLIAADRALFNRVELCDFIYYDEQNIYFIHNKRYFNGSMVRDVTNQLNASSQIINTMITTQDIRTYYDTLKVKAKKDKIDDFLRFEVFENIFNLNKVFVCCILDKFNEETAITYAKILIADQQKIIESKFGYDYKIISLKENLDFDKIKDLAPLSISSKV